MDPSEELQRLLYDRLCNYPALTAIIAGRVFDRVPKNTSGIVTADYPYLSFGTSDYVPNDGDCIVGTDHTIQINVWSRAVGATECKRVADLVKRALHEAELSLSDNALVEIRVESVRFNMEQDGLTSRGIVTVNAMIDEI